MLVLPDTENLLIQHRIIIKCEETQAIVIGWHKLK